MRALKNRSEDDERRELRRMEIDSQLNSAEKRKYNKLVDVTNRLHTRHLKLAEVQVTRKRLEKLKFEAL